MPFTLTSVSPATVSSAGGSLLTITGTFEIGNQYNVYCGDAGTADDPPCYSGIRDQGNVVYPFNSTTLRCYSPYVNPSSGAAYDVLVVNIDTTEAHILSSVVTAAKKQFYTSVYGLRKVLAPRYNTGPRTIDYENPTTT